LEKDLIHWLRKYENMARSQTPKRTQDRVERDRYLELVRKVPLRPIGSEAELDRAIAMIDTLLDQDKRDGDEEDYLDVLSDLVEKYEDEHDPMPPVSGAEMLRFLIESQATRQTEVASETGIAESTISEILAGKREMNRKHIEALARHFHVNPTVFMSV
jgi:HTH-type transcriptional regulator / antitoxin HigA